MEIEKCCEEYHKWYYLSHRWKYIRYRNVPIFKWVGDLWNYQQLLSFLKPSLVIEFGTFFGGSALYFSDMLKNIHGHTNYRILTVDVMKDFILPPVKQDPNIEIMTASSISSEVKQRIIELRKQFPGRIFAILDSDHSQQHVFNELMMMRDLLVKDDYVIVEDGNINGHPIYDPKIPITYEPGPYEAIQEYIKLYPNDYSRDIDSETKFGFTFAPNGYLLFQGKS